MSKNNFYLTKRNSTNEYKNYVFQPIYPLHIFKTFNPKKPMRRKIIPYDKKLKEYARRLRNKSTKSEILLWKCIHRRKLKGYRFIRQKPLDHFIADFYCYDLKLVIELDGYTHDFPDVKKKDKRKQLRLESFGLTLIRFKDEEVFGEIDAVIKSILEYIENFEKRNKIV